MGKLFLHQCLLILNFQLLLLSKGNIHLSNTQGPSAAHRQGFISYSIKNRITLVAFCNKQLCKNVVSSPQVLVRKIKQIKMRWCVVLFSRSCFIQTENNISYDNKQNKYTTMNNTPSCAVSHVSPCALNVKAREFWWLHSSGYRRIVRPFSFNSTKQLREEEEEYRGDGARGWWTLCRFGLCMFSAHCPSCKKLKCSSGLQLSSISNRS